MFIGVLQQPRPFYGTAIFNKMGDNKLSISGNSLIKANTYLYAFGKSIKPRYHTNFIYGQTNISHRRRT